MQYMKLCYLLFNIMLGLVLVTQLFPTTNQLSTPIVSKDKNEQLLINDPITNQKDIDSCSSNTRLTTRNDFSVWGIENFEGINLDNPNQNTIYPGLQPYIFRFKVGDFDKFQYVTSVNIVLINENQNYVWHRYDGNRLAGSGQLESRELNYTTGYYIISNVGYLDFNITFPWPENSGKAIHTWDVQIIENYTELETVHLTFDYNLVDSVKFLGLLQVRAEQQGIIYKDDWVHKSENITWTGLKLIYDSETDIVPPKDQAQIYLTDDDGDTWYDESNYGEFMRIYSQTDPITDDNNIHILDIQGPAKDYLIEKISFSIRIDGDVVYFFEPIPDPEKWHIDTNIQCGITVTDNKTSGVAKSSVEFRFSKNNGKTWNGWYKPNNILENGSEIGYSNIIDFIEGEKNLIQWRGHDLAGNTYSYSPTYRIQIDKSPLIFKNPRPEPVKLVYSSNLNCSIEIFDEISGVKAESIQYSIKLPSKINWSEWKIPVYSKYNRSLNPYDTVDFEFGEFNYIKWRAMDVAGNGYFVSQPYQLNITHKTPEVYLISPKPGELVNVTKPTLRWANTKKLVQPVHYVLHYWPDSDPGNKTTKILSETEYTMDRVPKFGETYNWEVIPETIDEVGSSISGIWSFTMNTLANIQPWVEFEAVATMGNNIDITPNGVKSIEILIYNKGNQYDYYNFELMADPDWNETVEFANSVFVPANSSKTIILNFSVPDDLDYGRYPVKIKISSTRAFLINKTLNKIIILDVHVKNEDKKFELPLETAILISFAIVIIVVVLLVLYFLVSRAKLKKFEEELMHAKTPAGKKATQMTEKDVQIEYKPDKGRKVVDRSSKGVEESIMKGKK